MAEVPVRKHRPAAAWPWIGLLLLAVLFLAVALYLREREETRDRTEITSEHASCLRSSINVYV